MSTKHCTGILILNYNNWEDTINCIMSVEKYNTAGIKYIVIDNGSTNKESVERINHFLLKTFGGDYKRVAPGRKYKCLPRVSFCANPKNMGYAQGNNIGLDLAYEDEDIDEILVLNNDILFVQDIIPKLREKIYTIPDCGIVSPVLYTKGLEQIDYNCARHELNPWELIVAYLFMYKDVCGVLSSFQRKQHFLIGNEDMLNNEIIKIELPSGSCMLFKKEIMRGLNSFDPNTFLYYEEDILHQKLKSVHLNNYLVTCCKCIHLGASSTSKTPSAFALSCQFSSSIYYIKKYVKLSFVQSVLFKVGTHLFPLKLWLIKKFK